MMTPERFDYLRLCGKPETAECLDEISRLAAMVYVPGCWYCPKCKFQLTQSVLYARTGAVGVNRKHPDPCPNDGATMLPQTWEAVARAMAERMARCRRDGHDQFSR